MPQTYERDIGPRCPYCSHLNQADEAYYFDERTGELSCNACGKDYAVRVYNSTSWTCDELPPPPTGDK